MTFNKSIVTVLILSFLSFSMESANGGAQAQDSFPPALEPYLSADGFALYNAAPTLVMMVDPNPAMQGIKIQAPEVDKILAGPDAAGATFSITYVTAGNTDPWGQVCTTFPVNAKAAFNAAAAIWTSTVQSSVPITIKACWASLPNPSILGYSGGAPIRRDFSGAPHANTWYEGALANALHGNDLDPGEFDMNITYNSNFTWYYGTDSNPPPGQHDLVTVAAHEIAHGLNFSGSADYAGGTGSYGYGGYPVIYDTFIESEGGTKLTSYTNPSAALGSLLTSNNLWFDGSNANAANGGTRVKMYAPNPWKDGSSYSHLDYSTFAGTVNSMMVYAIAPGSANHNPGPVTKGLLKDLGWILVGAPTATVCYLPMIMRTARPSAKPKAGFWQSTTGDEFYVTTNQVNVDNFAIHISVNGCGNYKITHLTFVPIVGKQFSFTGPFYASGTFDTTTSAHGTDGLNSFYISGCGYISGGPWYWTATWQNSTQPSIVAEGDTPSVIRVPALQMPYYFHTITIK